MRRLIAPVLVTGAVLVSAACSGDGTDVPGVDSVPATDSGGGDITLTFPPPSGGATAEVPDTDAVSPAAARDLCDTLAGELGGWREQGGTGAKVSYNATVQSWAARNGGLNDIVVRDRAVVDTLTTQTCPDVRQQALDALELSDLASGLVGFGN